MDNQALKALVEAQTRQAQALEKSVQIMVEQLRVGQQHLNIALGRVQQIDFNTLPENVRESFTAQLGGTAGVGSVPVTGVEQTLPQESDTLKPQDDSQGIQLNVGVLAANESQDAPQDEAQESTSSEELVDVNLDDFGPR